MLPLLALVLRRRSDMSRVWMVIAAGASYAVLFAILLWQALRGQPLVHPDALSVAVYSAWAALTGSAGVPISVRESGHPGRLDCRTDAATTQSMSMGTR